MAALSVHTDTSRSAAGSMLLQDALSLSYRWPDNPPGFDCGLAMIDHHLGGLQRGQLHLLSAPMESGATSLLLNMMIHSTHHAGVLFVTSTPTKELALRLVRCHGGLDSTKIVTEHEVDAATDGLGRWMRFPFLVFNPASVSDGSLALHLTSEVARLREEGANIGLLVLDATTEAESGDVCRLELEQLRQVARDLDAAVVATVQLPTVSFPVKVGIGFGGRYDEDEDSFAYQAEPWWQIGDEVIPGAPEGVERGADVLMLLQWSVDPHSGMAYEDRRILQIRRCRDRFHNVVELHFDRGTEEFWEDEDHRLSTCPSRFDFSIEAIK